MKPSLLLTALAIAWVTTTAATPERVDDDTQTHALILAQPQEVTLLKDLSGPTPDGGLYFGSRFKVRLKVIRIEYGPDTIPKTLTLEMTATHKENLTSKRVIYVLLELDPNQKPRALYWDHPQSVACVPRNILDGTDIQKYFVSFHRMDDSDCTPIQLPP